MKTKSLLPNIILSVILALCLFGCTAETTGASQNQVQTSLLPQQVVYIQGRPVEPIGVEWVETKDPTILTGEIEKCEARKSAAHQLAENARLLGYDEDSPVIELARSEWNIASAYQSAYKAILNSLEVDAAPDYSDPQKEQEYYYAAKVWQYLHEYGYNDWVSAGIIGNMMTECGGQTLDLQVTIDNGNHYGMCQWSHRYYPQVIGMTFEEQFDFLMSNIQYEINTFGFNYKQGFDYSDFCSLTDERQAAKAFAKAYERPGSDDTTRRQNNAEVAYQYFVG